jgi:hypothetical protein
LLDISLGKNQNQIIQTNKKHKTKNATGQKKKNSNDIVSKINKTHKNLSMNSLINKVKDFILKIAVT